MGGGKSSRLAAFRSSLCLVLLKQHSGDREGPNLMFRDYA